MLLRNSTTLGLTLAGVILLTIWAAEDPQTMKLIAGSGCFLLARVYWQVARAGR
jgi:hypothetical protein